MRYSYFSILKTNISLLIIHNNFKKPVETIKKLAEFLGKDLSDEKIDAIKDWCSFKKMKENPSVNYEWYKEFGLFKKDGHFFRKGEIGDWLNYFSSEESKKLDEIVDKNLKLKHDFNYGISKEDLDKIYSFKNNNIKTN